MRQIVLLGGDGLEDAAIVPENVQTTGRGF